LLQSPANHAKEPVVRNILILLAAAGVIARLYSKSRGVRSSLPGSHAASAIPDDWNTRTGADLSDSPSDAERLRASPTGGAYAGVARSTAPDRDDGVQLFPTSSSQDGKPERNPDQVSTGLPDFNRGA
jgi:hypothetical protein